VLITNHVLAGALIGDRLPLPAAAVAGFVSHFAMDTLPHYGFMGAFPLDTSLAKKDGVLGLVVIAGCASAARPERRLAVLAGIFGACLPDTDKLGEYFVGRSPWPVWVDAFHKRIQREAGHRMPVEIATGAALAALAFTLLPRAR